MTDYITTAGQTITLEREAARPQARNGTGYRIGLGQRFHRAGFTAVVWRVVAVYRDAQGLEHATLADESGRLDEKTLCASVLLDRAQYRLI